jgi:broad specificity phosphatase PhoE
MSTNYCLFRHGETDWNKEKRFMGQTDIPLNNVGKEQAINLAERLKELSLIELHSSDLQRTKETAQIIATETGIHSCKLRFTFSRNFMGWVFS